ncbi:Pyridoxal 4-dehydrogenase [Streptomyces sp. MBT84]|nr:Pyridoxal 4-dehydrogenase [Streptomyces sp. MBT84]
MPFARLASATTPTCHIGLGLAAVGRPGYINLGRDQDLPPVRSVDALRGRTHELLDAAYAQGVRYFDAARSYGRAEEFLADWLHARPPSTTSSSAASGATPTLPTGAPTPSSTR